MDNSIQTLEWFPMRVTYCRELKMKEQLDKLNIENFVPMRYELVETRDGRSLRLMPAIHNLIFVRTTKEDMTKLKLTCRALEPLRYMMRPVVGNKEKKEIIRVPDRQMENFMRVASVTDERVMFLEYGNYLEKVGQHVKVTNGFFAGVEGVIKRIKNNKRVVVMINGIAAVAIVNVPVEYLIPIE